MSLVTINSIDGIRVYDDGKKLLATIPPDEFLFIALAGRLLTAANELRAEVRADAE